jgi:hypothetical protein
MKIVSIATPANNQRARELVRAYCNMFGTQRELSRKTGIPLTYISQWLNNQDELFSVERLNKIRQACGLFGTPEQWNKD